MFLFYLIDKNYDCMRLLQSPNRDLTVASQLLFCSISELRVQRWSWDSLKQAASVLAGAWHKIRRSAIGAFDDDIINTPQNKHLKSMCF